MSLELIGLEKSFGAVTAVAGVDLGVAEGELLAIVGPSGCGKTTLLRMVAGLITPDAGSVLIQGVDATFLPPERRNVSIVFQNFALFPHMTVAENVAYGLRRRSVPRERREARIDEMLAMVGLGGYRGRRPHELSAGEQQRVALARALAPGPGTLLLDEPLSALDADLRERLRREIRRIQKEMGITTLLVTHDQEEALHVADRVAVMDRGRLVQVDEAWRLYDDPATPFVARFIGRGSFVPATLDNRGADLGQLGRLPREALPGRRLAGSRRALAFFRPESVQIAPSEESFDEAPPGEGESEPRLTFDGILEDVAFSGDSCMLQFRVADATREPVLASAPGRQAPIFRERVGARFRLSVPFVDLRWFPDEGSR